ncbi:ATP-binding protein [Actinomadura sp. GC306]|uniref:protein DpdH n=1 Tax=Actinomadura sp. GC306 TaxID=2530367 RepID=UPI00104F059A|nr:protein DpdH [Actinomadura sp. GC306]TDC70564.1 ATP-binding protein [Actinomadura sp. GC306]
MSDLHNTLCWIPEIASATVNTEAINPSPAVFLATHAPLRIRQAAVRGRELIREDIEVSEEDVLKDFLTRKADTGTLLMPIVGDSGSGKSHLVRWVRENISDTNKYQVIYLEKSRTSLKAVIEELLSGVQDDSLDRLRADINSFSSGLDEIALARRLVNALNEALAATSPKDMQGAARILAGPKGLATILQDPHIQGYILAEGGFISTLASQLLSNRGAIGPERAPGFDIEDLPLGVSDIREAARVPANLLGKIMSSSDLQSAAVDLINLHIDTAVGSVANLGGGRLFEAMLQVREAYARKRKEIVLLVEDFALVQGVQRELLEALTEAATREGKQRYAPMRTLMAITTGYFRELPETVLTRVAAATGGHIYDLDRVFSEEDDGGGQITSFVGRYLNAARVGRQKLEQAGLDTVPNKCATCPYQKTCHEAFGSTEEGYGLYPFNESALKRMVHSVAPSDKPWAFIPRAVLSNVIRPMLIDHAREINEGEFPSRRVKERFRTASIDSPLSSALEGEIDNVDKANPDRRKILLEFWGDAPSDPRQIDDAVLKAFSLPPLSNAGTRPPVTKPLPEKVVQPPKPGGLSPSQQRRIQALEDWTQRQEVLPQDIAGVIRSIVADTVFRRYDWSAPLMRELPRSALGNAWSNQATVVSIEGSVQRLPGTDRAPIKFKRNPVNSQFFQSLYLAKEDSPEARGEHLRRLAKIADDSQSELSEAIVRHMEISDEELTIGLRASLIGAALAGRAAPKMSDEELLAVALDDGGTWRRGDIAFRIDGWRSLLETHLGRRRPLVERLRTALGLAQGTGAVQMIDAARALPLLRDAQRSWTWETPEKIPSWVRPAVAGFGRWNSYVMEQFDALALRIGEIRKTFAQDESGPEVVRQVRSALTEAEKVGLGPGQHDQLRALLASAEAADWRAVTALEKDIKAATSEDDPRALDTVLLAVAPDRGAALMTISEFLRHADQWLTSALAFAAGRSDTSGDAAVTAMTNVLNDWASLIETQGNNV